MKLTRLALRKLEPGQHVTVGGIRFDRLANGDGRYTVEIMVDRRRIHRVIGLESSGVTLTQAQELIDQLRADARRDRLALPVRRKVVLGFSQAADDYLQRLEASQGRNVKQKRQQLTQHLKPFFGDKPLSRIVAFDMQRYVRHRQSQGASPATTNRELAVMSHLMHRALEWGWIDRAIKTPRLRENNRRLVYLTPDQIRQLLDAAGRDACWEIYPFILIALNTSMRLMEILSIRWEYVYLDRRLIHILHAKAGARDQPITATLADYLRDLRALTPGAAWLFPGDSKIGHRIAIEKPFRRVVAAAGLNPQEVTRHTLRHTAITHLVQAGVDLPTVQRISGHKTLAMVARYSHQSGEHIASAMDRLSERVTQELRRDEKRLAG
jgi:integrase